MIAELLHCYPHHNNSTIQQFNNTTIHTMFGLFKKDPAKQLREQYAKLLEEARDLQRKGDIKGFAQKSEEAEEIAKKLEELQQS